MSNHTVTISVATFNNLVASMNDAHDLKAEVARLNNVIHDLNTDLWDVNHKLEVIQNIINR